MPRNGIGQYSPPTGTFGVSGTVISSSAYDTFINDLSTEVTNSVNVQGTAPMLAPLNMGAFRIINAASPVAATDVAIKSYVDATVPAGFIMAFAVYNASIPQTNGWLYCNGTSVSTTTYAKLFAAIGYSYGGSGAGFNIPDFRGCFLRGYDGARGLDFQGQRAASAFQASYLINHFHAVSDPSHAHGVGDPTHVHPIAQTPHTHGVSDPSHVHAGGASATGSFGIGNSFPAYTQVSNTAAAFTGISIVAGFANINNNTTNNAFTGISISGAFTGITIGSVSTGNVNFAATETTVQNYPVLWCIKY
jgi:microcystin-dependent protein